MACPGFQGILNPVFPQSLKKLSLSSWGLISWKDMMTVGSLPNLQVLKLRGFGCLDDKWETTEGEFARLRFLLIERSDLRDWVTESGHFPSLKWLLAAASLLREIPVDIAEIPTLELIEVKHGSESLMKSASLIEEDQKDMGNDSLQVRCIKSHEPKPQLFINNEANIFYALWKVNVYENWFPDGDDYYSPVPII